MRYPVVVGRRFFVVKHSTAACSVKEGQIISKERRKINLKTNEGEFWRKS